MRATAAAWIANVGIVGGLMGFAAGRFIVDAWGIPATITALGLALLAVSPVVFTLPETKGLILVRGAVPMEPPSSIPG